MKKVTIGTFLAAAAIFAASCSSDKSEITPPVDNSKISLLLSTEGAAETSRATPITSNVLPPNAKFTLSAFTISGKDVYSDLDKKEISVDGTGGSVTGWGTYYWPVGDNLKFYAYYPTESAAKGTLMVTNTKATPKMDMIYTVNKTSFDNQDDLLYAYKQNSSASGSVSLEFQHALTRLTFQCKVINAAEASISTLAVTKVAFKNSIWKGTLTVDNTGTASWTPDNASKTPSQEFVVSGPNLVKGTPAFTEIFSTAANNSFLMIPSTNADFAANSAEIELTFRVNGTTDRTGTIPLKSLLSNTHEWPRGKHVNYQMTFNGLSGATMLVVNNVSVVEWGTQIDVPVEIN